MKRALFVILLGVLCVGTALAGTTRQVVSKLNGKTAGANFSAGLPGTTGGYISFYLEPSQLPDGSFGYYADIYWTEDGSHYNETYGLLPASVVNTKGLGSPITVDITDQDFDTLASPFGDSGDFISLDGTFTPYTGIGSGSDGGSGRNYNTETHLDGSTETFTFNGTGKGESATFEGTFESKGGTYDLSVQAPDPNASMFVQVGTQTDTTTTP